jgi:hypothetical protein
MSSESYTWPREVLQTGGELPRHDQNHLICFLACAFRPKERADELMSFVQTICDSIGENIGAKITCIRGDQISIPGTIHTDIWRYIQLADALIFDVTGLNGNVLLELGVAAAVRPQSSVLILRDFEDQSEEGRILFDIAPTRHLIYRRTLSGALEFTGQLKEALLHALTPAPYIPPNYNRIRPPIKFDLRGQGDRVELLGPPSSHRRSTAEGLEFGSFYVFRNSWLTLGNEDYANVSVTARFKISERHPRVGPADGWIGVSLCSAHFFANYSHLVYIKPDGSLWYVEPTSESTYVDKQWGELTDFTKSAPIEISVALNSETLTMMVNGISNRISVVEMPFRRHAGKVRLQTHLCRAILEYLQVDELS